MTMMTAEHIANEPEYGMTLRDYFAAKAMEGMFARDRNRKLVVSAEENARTAYEWADAMLKAREQ
jgi:hypothetical protein